ncbi:MAG: cysteine hydrolase [Deltaproteobacteria bacterium]|nr:cysteine hydrolase [Deltaproteobacteria bacterium]
MLDAYLKPDYDRCCLITIDVQSDTLDGKPFEVPGTSEALPQIISLSRRFRGLKKNIAHIVRIYEQDGSNADLCRKSALERGTPILLRDSEGSQLAEGLLPAAQRLDVRLLKLGEVQILSPYEIIIYKPRWGAFYRTALDPYLKALEINTLIFTGCNFPNCPRTTVYEASERDYRIVFVRDAVSGVYERGIKELEEIGVTVISTDDLLRALS